VGVSTSGAGRKAGSISLTVKVVNTRPTPLSSFVTVNVPALGATLLAGSPVTMSANVMVMEISLPKTSVSFCTAELSVAGITVH